MSGRREPVEQPRTREPPVAIRGGQRHTEGVRGFLQGEAGEEAELDQSNLPLINPAQLGQRFIQRHHIEVGGRHRDEIILELDAKPASLSRAARPGVIDQRPPHHLTGGPIELSAVGPLEMLTRQLQKHLMQQIGWRQRVMVPFPADVRRGTAVQFAVDQCGDLFAGGRIAPTPLAQQGGDAPGLFLRRPDILDSLHRRDAGTTRGATIHDEACSARTEPFCAALSRSTRDSSANPSAAAASERSKSVVSSAHTQYQREIESILPFVQVERIGVGRRIAVRASETCQRLHDERTARQRVLPSLHVGDGLTIGGARGREITLIECGPTEGDEADDAIRVAIHVVALLDVFERGQTTLARLVQPAHPSQAFSVEIRRSPANAAASPAARSTAAVRSNAQKASS